MKALLVSLGRMRLEGALERQRAAREAVIAGRGEPVVFLVEHEPVYTIGRAGVRRRFPEGDPRRWPSVLASPPHLVVELDRGGDVTWHGPGQLVMYPVLPLKPLGLSLVGYIRALEAAAVEALARFGAAAHARKGLTGVWVGEGAREAKLGAIGVGCRRWVTYHGLSVNVACDLAAFEAIRPCGMEGARVTSLAEVMRRRPAAPPALDEVGRAVADELARVVGFDLVATESNVRDEVAIG